MGEMGQKEQQGGLNGLVCVWLCFNTYEGEGEGTRASGLQNCVAPVCLFAGVIKVGKNRRT